MTTIRTYGDQSQIARWKEALLQVSQGSHPEKSSRFYNSHRDTENLRFIAERYRRRKRSTTEGVVHFEMDQDGMILVKIEDEMTADFQLRLTPEQVERALQGLEETDDNEAALSSFFIDIKN